MEVSLQKFLIALPLAIMAGGAWAQDSATVTDNCANHLNTSPNPTVGALLNCLAEMQRTIAKLEAAASTPSALSSSDIAAIITELKTNHADDIKGEKGDAGEPGQVGADGSPGRNGNDALIPVGAVMAFDLPNGCPMGWKTFEEATSRVIVGAYADRAAGNITAPTEDENGNALSARHYRNWGGTEKHKLEISELPSHDHAYIDRYVVSRGDAEMMTDGPIRGWRDHERTTKQKGGNIPHNNMPPYIALHYCKKEKP